ncbi:MAG: hypothetical protein IKB86_03475 [Clostridia bacterium]|nr:hypothetical protein [Clostridia bacterium]
MEKKCPNCSSINLSEGVLQTNDAMRFTFISKEQSSKLFPKTTKVQAFVCQDCGFVSLFTVENKK